MLAVAPDHNIHTYYSAPAVATLRGGLEPGEHRRTPGFWFALPLSVVAMFFLVGIPIIAVGMAVVG
ncbi:hypothetical protein ACFXNW_21200 [Nocardia sp. NPDC059180]|uniref:hypothetical protein n=1 Tax=Nocardia sp. NPDC059180 TaxID=3346761 RepID=UPI0036A609E8